MPKPKPKQPKGLYNKYTILDAKTGKVKEGKYFVLRLDTKSTDERCCVACALTAYVKQAKEIGVAFDKPYYKKLAHDVAKMLSDTRDDWVSSK